MTPGEAALRPVSVGARPSGRGEVEFPGDLLR